MKNVKMPFYQSSTTLLHLLMMLGFDCIKPDTIVMRVAIEELGIVGSEKRENDRIGVVRDIQDYSVNNKIKPSIVDFYLLIEGGQTWARKFVDNEFKSVFY